MNFKRFLALAFIVPFLLATPALAHFEHQVTKTTTIAGVPYMYVSHGDTGDWMPYFQKMVTKKIVTSTSWSEFAKTGAVSKNDIVLIPEGVTLTVDSITPQFHTLVVEGNLVFSKDKNTELKVGTVVVYPTGSLTMRPISNVKSIITLGGYKPYDPAEFTLGLISLGGKVDIEGISPGISFAKVSDIANLQKKPGDELIFSDSQTTDASHWSYSHYNLSLVTALPQQWELRTVTSGSNLDKPLQYPHEDYVANLTRNVIIRSESAANRAHVMLMGETKISIKNARFMDLGRTDSLKEIDNTIFDANGNVTHAGKNNQARYALHIHHAKEKFLLEGNVVTGSVVDRNLNNTTEHAINGSPRWGIVNHNSFGDIKNNIVVGAAGSGIVGETGTETGTVTGNLVIGTGQATGGGDDGRFAPLKGIDLAYGGFGYWFRGPFLTIDNNIATGYFKQGGFGFFFHPLFSESQLPNIPGMSPEYKGKNINVNSRGLLSFKNNKAVGLFGSAGFIMFYTSVPHTISNFTEVNRNTNGRGFEVEYTQKLTVTDSKISGAGGTALWTNKETKEIVTTNTTFEGFKDRENKK